MFPTTSCRLLWRAHCSSPAVNSSFFPYIFSQPFSLAFWCGWNGARCCWWNDEGVKRFLLILYNAGSFLLVLFWERKEYGLWRGGNPTITVWKLIFSHSFFSARERLMGGIFMIFTEFLCAAATQHEKVEIHFMYLPNHPSQPFLFWWCYSSSFFYGFQLLLLKFILKLHSEQSAGLVLCTMMICTEANENFMNKWNCNLTLLAVELSGTEHEIIW